MKTIDILRLVDGVETVIYTVSTKDTSLDQEMMKKDEVSIDVTTEDPLSLQEGDYVTVDGVKYKINREPESKLSSEKKNQYTITLESPIYTLIDKYLSDKITGNTTITLTGKLKDFLDLIVWNVNYDKDGNPLGVDNGWTVGECPDTDYMNITFTATKCRDALNTLADKFGLEYYVTGKTINYVKYISNETGLVFTQGQGNGLYEIEKENVDSDDLVTRVFPKGGTDNVIPGEGDSEGRLILPEKYLENFSDSKRVVEAVVEFDNIHPSFTGTVANVSGTNNRSFTCPELNFDINDVAYGDGSERINFLTGDLMGKSFEFNWSSSEKKMTLVSQEDTLAPIDTATKKRPTIPSTSKYLRGGEKFNFTGIKLGEAYKDNAIKQLRDKATDWLGYYCRKRVKFVLNVDYRYLRQKGITLHLGDLVTIKAPTHNINMIIRIIKIEKNLYTGKLSCTVSNYLDERWEKRIQDQVTEIKSTIESSNGGKWGETSVTILGRDDPRTETDDNVYSSARTNQEISDRAISKTDDDTANGLITFLKGLCSKVIATFEKGIKVIGGIITDSIKVSDKTDTNDLSVSNQATIDKIVSSVFTSGQLGTGFTLYNQEGKSYMEIDELLVRVKAVFTSLEIRKLNYLGDNMLFTSAGCKIARVEETDTTYKCYFMSDDGTTATTNDFVVGDQVRCQTFNIKAGKYTNVSNKYYWRYVSAVGDGYIELSKTDCDTNSDVPAAGDALVQLGNRTDSTRQNAILLAVSGNEAPALIQYAGICGYSLSGKDTTVISPSGNKFVAKSFAIQVGDSIVKIPTEKGEWIKDTPYSYYDRVSHNGSLWLCVIAEGKTTTDEPTDTSTSWQKQVSKGNDGKNGNDGADGKNGNDGAKGDKGDAGAQGDKGDKGDTGNTGATGAKGDKGDTGTKGDDGYMCTLSPESVTLNDDESGNITNLSLATTTVKLLKGTAVVTPTIVVGATSGCNAIISGSTVVITAIPQNTKQGYVDILITSDSFNVTKRFSFQVIDYTITKTIALNTANGALSLKADQKTVDDMGKVVDQNSLDISANAKAISLKMNSGDFESMIDQHANKINLTVKSQINDAVDNVQVSNRNRAQGTSNSWSSACVLSNIVNDCFFNIPIDVSGLQVGDTLCFSFDVKYDNLIKTGTGEANAWIQFYGDVNSWNCGFNSYLLPQFDFTTGSGSFHYCFFINPYDKQLLNNYYYAGLRFDYLTGNVYIKSFRVVKSTKDVDWTPAIEDIDADISKRPTTDQIKSSLTMDTDGISLLGKKILLGGMITFQSLDSGAQKKITDAQGTADAANKAAGNAQNAANTAQGTASGAANAASGAQSTANDAQNKANTVYNQVNWQYYDAAVDLNNMTTTGKYMMRGAISNTPVSQWAYLVVEYADSARITQTIWHDTDATNKYTRSYYGGTWGGWSKIANSSEITDFKNSLGGLAYESDVQKAMEDKGLISGGYLKMSLIDVAKVVAAGIQAKTIDAQNATFKNLNVQNGKFTGELDGVTGSFQNLNCVDGNGKAIGGIAFDTTGIWINGCDFYHQGIYNKRNLRFYSSNIFCRGAFGHSSKAVAVVSGNIIKYYVNGYGSGDYVQGALKTYTYNGYNFYKIPVSPASDGYSQGSFTYQSCYGNASYGDVNGFQVDMIIIDNGNYSLPYYMFVYASQGKEITIFNRNNSQDVVLAQTGGLRSRLPGGMVSHYLYWGDGDNPAINLGCPGDGWFCTGYNDNNW